MNPPIVPVLEALHPDYKHMGLDTWGGWRSIRCAFHGERHASASYSADENVFVCHTCGLKGDAYQLVMEVESLGFIEAKQRVAEITGHSGVTLPAGATGIERGGRTRLPVRKGTADQRRARLSARTRPGRRP